MAQWLDATPAAGAEFAISSRSSSGPLRSERSAFISILVRAEVFNVFNHPNFVGYSGTYGNGPDRVFGAPLPGITNQLPARELQFMAR